MLPYSASILQLLQPWLEFVWVLSIIYGNGIKHFIELLLMSIFYKLDQGYGLGLLSSCQSIHVSNHSLIHMPLGL